MKIRFIEEIEFEASASRIRIAGLEFTGSTPSLSKKHDMLFYMSFQEVERWKRIC